jgi:hypothetical protein
MYKDTTYKEKIVLLKKWAPVLLDPIKKELKNDHIRQDWGFARKYLAGKNLNKMTLEDLVQAYMTAITTEESGEQIAEFITNRWMLKNTEMYHFFEQRLSQINPNFSEIDQIRNEAASQMVNEAVAHFGAPRTYLFGVLNSVAFSPEIFAQLSQKADEAKLRENEEEEEQAKASTFEELKKNQEREIARLIDKYEKKLAGMQKKYLDDTTSLKKQLATLQRKL